MTRKQYIRRLQELVIAIHRRSEKTGTVNGRLGDSLRTVKRNVETNDIRKVHGSYQAAWDSKEMKWARNEFGVR